MADCTILVVLNRVDDGSVERNTVELEHVIVPSDPVVTQLVEPNMEMPSRRSQYIRKLTFYDDYVCLHKSHFNLGQANDPNNFSEAMSCSDSDDWVI